MDHWTISWTIFLDQFLDHFLDFFILKEQFFFHLADALIIFIKSTQVQITELLYTTTFTSGHKTENDHSLVKHLYVSFLITRFTKAITETYAEL